MGQGEIIARFRNEFSKADKKELQQAVIDGDEQVEDATGDPRWLLEVIPELVITNDQLKEMAQIAKENWLFDESTDPNGYVKKGLLYFLKDGEIDEDIINARLTSTEDWDGLDEWAKYMGSPVQ